MISRRMFLSLFAILAPAVAVAVVPDRMAWAKSKMVDPPILPSGITYIASQRHWDGQAWQDDHDYQEMKHRLRQQLHTDLRYQMQFAKEYDAALKVSPRFVRKKRT